MDPVNVLPTEIFIYLLTYLTGKELLICVARVNRIWYEFTKEELLWKVICRKQWKFVLIEQFGGSWCQAWKEKNNKWKWNKNSYAKECVEFSVNGMTIKKIVSVPGIQCLPAIAPRYITIRNTKVFKRGEGIFYWEVKIIETERDFLKIGVCKKDVPPLNSLGFSDFGWGFSGDFKWHNTAIPYNQNENDLSVDSKTVHLRRFIKGDIVGVLLDMNNATVSFFLNGKNCGVAFTDLPDELYAGVSLDAIGECVELDIQKEIPSKEAYRTVLSSD